MVELFKFKQKTNLEGFTLIIPSVCVGNVSQLTIDLLITSLNFKKAATIWHPAVVSSVGPDPYDANIPELCTACELYVNEGLKIALIQLRSTVNGRLAIKFFTDLKNSFMEFKIRNILILTSSFDQELHVVTSNKFYYISNQDISEVMNNLNVKPQEVGLNGKYVVYGSGFAVKLFEVLGSNFECTVLIKYVSEGDNRPDAIGCINVLNKFVSGLSTFNVRDIRFPSSWNLIFGGPIPLGIF